MKPRRRARAAAARGARRADVGRRRCTVTGHRRHGHASGRAGASAVDLAAASRPAGRGRRVLRRPSSPGMRPGDLVVATEVRGAERRRAADPGGGDARRRSCAGPGCTSCTSGRCSPAERWSRGAPSGRLGRRRRARGRHGVGVAGRGAGDGPTRVRGRPGGHRHAGARAALGPPVPCATWRRLPVAAAQSAPVLDTLGRRRGAARGRARPAAVVLRRRRAGHRHRRAGRSSATARRSTCAARSSTTPTSSPTSAARGAVFVDELDEVPPGAVVVLAAHGVAPDVRAEADRPRPAGRSTRPARSSPRCTPRCGASPRRGYRSFLIGHADHEEVEGTLGEAPDADRTCIAHARRASTELARRRTPTAVAYVTQTTLAVDEAAAIVERCATASRASSGRARDDICYATQNRQDAVRALVAPTSTSCSSSARPTRRTRTASSRSPRATVSPPTSSTTTSELDLGLARRRPPRRHHRRRVGARGDSCSEVVDRARRASARSTSSEHARRRRGRRSFALPVEVPADAAFPLAPERCASARTCRSRSSSGARSSRSIVELEPLFACNLACPGCGKIQHPTEILRKRHAASSRPSAADRGVRRADGLDRRRRAAAAPARSTRWCAELVARKRFVYLCTNAVLLRSASSTSSRPSPYFAFAVHIDGLRERHDESVDREGVFDEAVAAIREAQAARLPGHHQHDVLQHRHARRPCVDVLDFLNDDLEVDTMMISPAYAYEKAPDQEHFLGVEQTRELFRKAFADGSRRALAAQPLARCSSTSSRARSTSRARRGRSPATRCFGWQRPCYLMSDGYVDDVPGADRDDGLGQLRPRQGSALRQLHGPLRLRADRRRRDDAVAAPVAAGDGQRPLRASREGLRRRRDGGFDLGQERASSRSDSLRRRAARGVRAGSPLPTRQVVTTPPSSLVRPSRKGALNERAFRSPPPCSLRGARATELPSAVDDNGRGS